MKRFAPSLALAAASVSAAGAVAPLCRTDNAPEIHVRIVTAVGKSL